MKRNLYVSLTALVLALTVNVAFAQSHSKSKANVPSLLASHRSRWNPGHTASS